MSEHDADYARLLAACAAGWWADLLRARRAPSLVRDAGHTELASFLGDGLYFSKTEPQFSAEQIDAFEQMLTKCIVEQLLAGPAQRVCRVYLRVDYEPEGLLKKVAIAAGVGLFPFKTSMSVDWEHIAVRLGRGAPDEALCMTKRNALGQRVAKYFPAAPELPAPDVRMLQAEWDAQNDAWIAEVNRLIAKVDAYPPFFPGDIEALALAVVGGGAP